MAEWIIKLINGILPVNKPPVLSSFDVIRHFKHNTHYEGKAGHGGTLDPFACGVMFILLGDATKHFAKIQSFPKSYIAGVRLGISSNTLDITGEITRQNSLWEVDKDKISADTALFTGEIDQAIPAFSAAKYEGEPLYKLARAGITVEKSKKVTVYAFDVLDWKLPLVLVSVICSSGTYVRQLTYDLFRHNKIDSTLFFLERRAIGDFDVSHAAPLSSFESEDWQKYVIDGL